MTEVETEESETNEIARAEEELHGLPEQEGRQLSALRVLSWERGGGAVPGEPRGLSAGTAARAEQEPLHVLAQCVRRGAVRRH